MLYNRIFKGQHLETGNTTKVFGALSSGVRLDLFRLLVRHGPDGLVAGDISRLLDVPTTNLSFHLRALLQAGLVSVEKEGRFLRYRANIPLMLDVIADIAEECTVRGPPMSVRGFARQKKGDQRCKGNGA